MLPLARTFSSASNFPSIRRVGFFFYLFFFCLTSPASLIFYTSALFLFASPPLCLSLCKVVTLISLSPVVYFPLYLGNYLSALSSRRTPSSLYLPLCKISPSALTFIHSHPPALPYLAGLTPSSLPPPPHLFLPNPSIFPTPISCVLLPAFLPPSSRPPS